MLGLSHGHDILMAYLDLVFEWVIAPALFTFYNILNTLSE